MNLLATTARSEAAPLVNRLQDGAENVRLSALAELLRPGADAARYRAEVESGLRHASERVRRMAVIVLGNVGPAAAPALLSALDDAQPGSVRSVAAAALGRLAGAAAVAVDPLIRCLAGADDALRWQAAFALRTIGGPAVPALRAALNSRDPRVQRAALDALAGMRPVAVEAAADVRRFAATAPAELQTACLAALVRLTGDVNAGLPGLVALLKSNDATRCGEAIERLGELHDVSPDLARDLAPAVEQRLGHASAAVRAAAALTLGRLGAKSEAAIAALAARLKDADAEVRASAGIALAALGPAAAAALPALEAMQADPERRPAAVAKAAVQRMAPAG